MLVGCTSGGTSTGSTENAPLPTPSTSLAVPTADATVAPTEEAPAESELAGLKGQDAATEVAIAEGSLGMTLDEFISSYNGHLDQGQYPISETPEETYEQVFQVTPDDTSHSTILFVVNTDGTLRSITALSNAASELDEIDRGMAQLEALVVWSTVAAAATPGLSPDEENNILGTIGLTGTDDFGTLSLTAEKNGIRYHVIEGDEGTNLIIREAN